MDRLKGELEAIYGSDRYDQARRVGLKRAEMRLRYQVLTPYRRAILGTIGTMTYLEAMGDALSRLRTIKSTRRPIMSLRALLAGPTLREGGSTLKVPPGFHYWSSTTIQSAYPDAPDHAFASELVDEVLYGAMNRVLGRIGEQQAFEQRVKERQAEFLEVRRWLVENDNYVGPGPMPLKEAEASWAALPAENVAAALQMINAWIEAVFVALPDRLQWSHKKNGMSLLRDATRTMALFQRSILRNWKTLFQDPASVSFSKFEQIAGKPPRPASPVPPGLLVATLRELPGGSIELNAHWTVPGVGGASARMPKCAGLPDAAPCDLRSQGIIKVSHSYLSKNRGRAENEASIPNLSLIRLLSILCTWTLAETLAPRIAELAPWMSLGTALSAPGDIRGNFLVPAASDVYERVEQRVACRRLAVGDRDGTFG